MTATVGHGIVGEAMRDAAAELAAQDHGEQLTLFPLPTRFEGERADELQAAAAVRHGPGRPPGAANFSNRRLREYLLRRGVNPLSLMMQWGLHTPVTLAAELGCTRLEAFRELRAIWAELGPYFASKLVAVDDAGKPIPALHMTIGQNLVSGAGQPPWEIREQFQRLNGNGSAPTHDEPTHDEPK